MLEDNFLDAERFLAIDTLNFNSFSDEYIKQYQTICSEIDVIAKSYCKELDCLFNGQTINSYCKCIVDNDLDFITRKVIVKDRKIELYPWKNWTYTINISSRGKKILKVNNPEWWSRYNKIKHYRTTINIDTGLPYFKLANQENVINSLAALFQLELYYFRKLHQKYFSKEPDMPGPQSKLFEIESWGNSWIEIDGNIRFKIKE